ncbi:MAG: hypothetical protein U1F41_06875 [Burkholderiales bacterium]
MKVKAVIRGGHLDGREIEVPEDANTVLVPVARDGARGVHQATYMRTDALDAGRPVFRPCDPMELN